MVSEPKVEILDTATVFQGFFRVDRVILRHHLFDGGWSRPIVREIFERGRSVAVLPYDPRRDEVVLIEQFRAPAHLAGREPWLVEAIAGMVEPGETPEEVARREALEEAGCVLTGPLFPAGGYFTSPGAATEWVDLFVSGCDASGLGGIHGLEAEGEDIKVLILPFARAMDELARGGIQVGPALITLYWLAAHRDEMRRVALAELPAGPAA